MAGFVQEFKKFAMRGNMVDMTIGIVIGTAFGAIAKSFVSDLIMPPLGLIVGNMDFSNLFVVLRDGVPGGPYPSLTHARDAGAVTVNYGASVNTVINFLVVAVAMFALIKLINRAESWRRQPEAAGEPQTKECAYCASSIPLRAKRCPLCTSRLES